MFWQQNAIFPVYIVVSDSETEEINEYNNWFNSSDIQAYIKLSSALHKYCFQLVWLSNLFCTKNMWNICPNFHYIFLHTIMVNNFTVL